MLDTEEEFWQAVNMKLAWLTDIHLNISGLHEAENLCGAIIQTGADAALITGDIATSVDICKCLEIFADILKRPIYFVLGNHDYYGSSIRLVNSQVTKIMEGNQHLIWLSRSGVIELSPDTCLIGHEGLADGRLGDPEGSTIDLNDYHRIKELIQPTKELRLQVQHNLGDSAARYLKKQLKSAIAVGNYKRIIVALHVPPFPEACWHLGKNSDDDFLPHFGCKATGDVLRTVMEKHPEIEMTVYCGHTHSSGVANILPNLRVNTAGAEYRYPAIAGNIEI